MKKFVIFCLFIFCNHSAYSSDGECVSLNEMKVLSHFYAIESYRSIEEIEKKEISSKIALRKFIKRHHYDDKINLNQTIHPFGKQRRKWLKIKKKYKKGDAFLKISYEYQFNTYTQIILLRSNCILGGLTYSKFLTHRKLPLIKP